MEILNCYVWLCSQETLLLIFPWGLTCMFSGRSYFRVDGDIGQKRQDAQRGKRKSENQEEVLLGLSSSLYVNILVRVCGVVEAITMCPSLHQLCLRAVCSTYTLLDVWDMNGFLSRRGAGKRADWAGYLLVWVLLHPLSLPPSLYRSDGWQPFPPAGERPRDVCDYPRRQHIHLFPWARINYVHAKRTGRSGTTLLQQSGQSRDQKEVLIPRAQEL